jgi:septation ring formation regulator EzrA
VGVVVPLVVLVLAAVIMACLLAKRNRRKREVREIERRKTMVRENAELGEVQR